MSIDDDNDRTTKMTRKMMTMKDNDEETKTMTMKDEDGEMMPYFGEINMGNSVYSTPIVVGNVLYISNRTHLFAIEKQE